MTTGRIVQSNKGSVFIITILIFSLLFILGLALMTASTTNYIMSSSYVDSNKAYYIADGIMEQVYVTLKRLSLQYDRAQMPEKIINAFDSIIEYETDAGCGRYVEIDYDVSVINPYGDIIFPVTVTCTINKASKSIETIFDLQISANVGPLFAHPFACGGNLVGRPIGNSLKRKINLKFKDKDEKIHISNSIIDIDFISHQPEILSDPFIEGLFDKFVDSGISHYDFGCEPCFFIKADGEVFELDLDFLENIGKKSMIIISTNDVILKSATANTFHIDLIVVSRGDTIFKMPDNKNVIISKISPSIAEELISSKIQVLDGVNEFFEGLGYLKKVNQDVKIKSWKEIN